MEGRFGALETLCKIAQRPAVWRAEARELERMETIAQPENV